MLHVKIGLSIVATVLIVNLLVKFNFVAPPEVEDEEEIATDSKKNSKAADRKPASKKEKKKDVISLIPKMEVTRNDRSESNFEIPEIPEVKRGAPTVFSGAGARRGGATVNSSSTPELNRQRMTDKRSSSSVANNNFQPGCVGDQCIKPPVCPGDPRCVVTPPPAPKCPGDPSCPPTPPQCPGDPSCDNDPAPNKCSADIISGSFNHPIGVKLSCDYTSEIKYCLELDTGSGCCDPTANPKSYSSKVVVGPANGTYCLRYYGDSASNGRSEINEQTYVINTALPHLLVSHPKTYFQTTQLESKTLITSTDFGKAGFGIGQINLKTHDPTVNSLSCEEIVEDYVSLPLPFAQVILALLDVAGDDPSQQIEIPMRPSFLDYGENFVTSYMRNVNYVVPIYSCSTTKITLNDFEFFNIEVASGDTGTNTVREFSGGFSAYGFFEEEATVYRGPAGENSNSQSGMQLQTGLFGVFY